MRPRPHHRLAGIVLAGLAARLWRLTMPPLTSDEAFSWRLASYPVADLLRRAAQDVHPPLYYLVLRAWLRAFGDGLGALRGLSVLSGVAAVAMAFLLVRDVEGEEGPRPAMAALLAAALVALHGTQVAQGANARMYAMGTVLALLGTWLVARALTATRDRAAWWAAWGLVGAAAVATHYYLAFTVLAQAVGAVLPGWPRKPRVKDLAVAGAIGAVALGPWVPAFLRQLREVRADYWIPPATPASLAEGLARWGVGFDAGRAAPLLALAVLVSLVAAARAGHAGRFLAVQAATPWVAGLVVSILSGRPIVLERCMVFAQALLACAWAVALARVGRPGARTAATAGLLALLASGLGAVLRARPEEPPAMAVAARFLKRQAAEGDLVVVESPRALNKLRYYARQAGGEGVDIRAALPERVPLGPHVSHVVSLAPGDDVPAGGVFATGRRTIWLARETTAPPDPAPAGWTITYARIFEGGDRTRFALARYEATGAAP